MTLRNISMMVLSDPFWGHVATLLCHLNAVRICFLPVLEHITNLFLQSCRFQGRRELGTL